MLDNAITVLSLVLVMLAITKRLELSLGVFLVPGGLVPHLRTAVLALSSWETVVDRPFLYRCLWLLGIVNVGFCMHSLIHLELATIALLGASLFMLIGHARWKPEDAEELSYLTDVE